MKQLTLTLLIVGLTTSVFGQQNKFDIGIVGSPSIVLLRGNEILKSYQKPLLSFSGGLSLQYNFPKIISIRTDLCFEKKGSLQKGTIDYTDNIGTVIDSEKWTHHSYFDYLTMPILIRATIGKKIKYFFNTGLFAGYLIKETDISEATKYLPKTTTDNTNNFNRLDYGITAGLGLTIPFKEKFLISCELRNNLGLCNISALPVYNDGSIKTNSTNLLIGFAYLLGARQVETK